jgi:RIO kinase 1
MLTQLVRILSCDLIHGDLSPYNVLWGDRGPTIIDFPQAISAAHNNSSEAFFLRDARNILDYFVAIDPSLRARSGDAREIWRAYLRRELTPDFVPTGRPSPAPERPRPPRDPKPHHQERPPQQQRGGQHEQRPSQQQRGSQQRQERPPQQQRGSQQQRGGQKRDAQPARGGEQQRRPPIDGSGGSSAGKDRPHASPRSGRARPPEVIVMTRRTRLPE